MKSFKAKVAKALGFPTEISEDHLLREVVKYAQSHHVTVAQLMGQLDQLIRLRKGESPGGLVERVEREVQMWAEVEDLVYSFYRLQPSPSPELIRQTAVDRVSRAAAVLEAQEQTDATRTMLTDIQDGIKDLAADDMGDDMTFVLAALMGVQAPELVTR